MNKKNNRKGFTTVELVIVIAVIAILAAVLIPTFSSLINKANESAALQSATSTFKSYLIENAETIKSTDVTYIKVLDDEGAVDYIFKATGTAIVNDQKPVAEGDACANFECTGATAIIKADTSVDAGFATEPVPTEAPAGGENNGNP